MTKTWAAAEISASARIEVDGRTVENSGSGEVAIDKGYATISWRRGDSVSRELVNDRAIFTQEDPPDGIWERHPTDSRTATSAFANPLLNLASLQQVQAVAEAPLGDFQAKRFTGTLPVTERNLEGLALTPSDMTEVLTRASGSDRVVVTAWVDPHNRIVRIVRSLSLADPRISATSTVDLTNFGVMLDLKSPPSASVTLLPS